MKSKYTPTPINTDDIELSPELLDLTEAMAKNVHEVWSKNRIAEGWIYGKDRNDILKTHPCLVPYEDLPESERLYDRETSLSTLKLIIKLGFNIKNHNHG